MRNAFQNGLSQYTCLPTEFYYFLSVMGKYFLIIKFICQISLENIPQQEEYWLALRKNGLKKRYSMRFPEHFRGNQQEKFLPDSTL